MLVPFALQECNAAAKDKSSHTWTEQQEAIPKIVSMLTYLLGNWKTFNSAAAERRKLRVVAAMDGGLLEALLDAISCTEHAPAARVAAVMGVNSLFGLFFSDDIPYRSLPHDVGSLVWYLQYFVRGRRITESNMQLPAAIRKQMESMANVAAATLITQLVSSGEEPLALPTALLVTLALLLHINKHARVIAIVSGVIAPIQAVLQASRFDPDSSGVFRKLQQLLHPDAARRYQQLWEYKNSFAGISDNLECAKIEALSMPLVWGDALGYDRDLTSSGNITHVAAVIACCLESSVIAAKGLLQVRDPDVRGVLLRSGLVQDLEVLMEQGLGASPLMLEKNVTEIMRLIGQAKGEAAALHPEGSD
eukprot:jgi/Chrzof1/4544/Cz14g17200.t1